MNPSGKTKTRNTSFQDVFDKLVNGTLSPFVMFYGLILGAGITTFVSVFALFPLTERITSAKQVSTSDAVLSVRIMRRKFCF